MMNAKKDLYLKFNDAAGKRSTMTMTEPGEPVTDVNGTPSHVTQGKTSSGTFAGATFTRREIEAVGLTAEDLPNLRIIDTQN